MRRVSTRPISSKKAIVALRSVTRIIVCRYSICACLVASSPGREHNASAPREQPLNYGTPGIGDADAGGGKASSDAEEARGGGLRRDQRDIGRRQARGRLLLRLARALLGGRA